MIRSYRHITTACLVLQDRELVRMTVRILLNFHLAFTIRRADLTIHAPLTGLLKSYRYQQREASR